jgi:hypothetical protein
LGRRASIKCDEVYKMKKVGLEVDYNLFCIVGFTGIKLKVENPNQKIYDTDLAGHIQSVISHFETYISDNNDDPYVIMQLLCDFTICVYNPDRIFIKLKDDDFSSKYTLDYKKDISLESSIEESRRLL